METSFIKGERQEMLETLVDNIPVLRSKMVLFKYDQQLLGG